MVRLDQVQPGGGSGETRGLRQPEHPVHPLHGAARGALVEIVDHAHHRDGAAVGRGGQVRVVAGDDILHPRRACP